MGAREIDSVSLVGTLSKGDCDACRNRGEGLSGPTCVVFIIDYALGFTIVAAETCWAFAGVCVHTIDTGTAILARRIGTVIDVDTCNAITCITKIAAARRQFAGGRNINAGRVRITSTVIAVLALIDIGACRAITFVAGVTGTGW